MKMTEYEVRLPDGSEYTTRIVYRGGFPDGTTIVEVRPGGRRFSIPVEDGRAQLWAREEIHDEG